MSCENQDTGILCQDVQAVGHHPPQTASLTAALCELHTSAEKTFLLQGDDEEAAGIKPEPVKPH